MEASRLSSQKKAKNRSANDVLDTQRPAPTRWMTARPCWMSPRLLAMMEEERRRGRQEEAGNREAREGRTDGAGCRHRATPGLWCNVPDGLSIATAAYR